MAQYWSGLVRAAMRSGSPEVYDFIDIQVETPIYMTNYPGDIDVYGRTYESARLQRVDPPKRTTQITQQINSIEILDILSGFTPDDFLRQLGEWHSARVIVRSLVVSLAGDLLTDVDDVVIRSQGELDHAYRTSGGDSVILDVSNSFGPLKMQKEFRTTVGSMAVIDPTDSSFNRAAALNKNITLEWGS